MKRSALILFTTLFIALLFLYLFWRLPRLSYAIRIVPIEKVCRKVRPGMTRADVLLLMDSDAQPWTEWGTEQDLYFEQRGVCEVSLEDPNNNVTKVTFSNLP